MISIVCPFYNEKENLEKLCGRLFAAVAGLRDLSEIIFVDDGSTDGGAGILSSLSAGKNFVRVLRLDRNYGLTTAMYAGLQAAHGEILATLDADLQNPPEEISRLVELLTEGIDMVTGIRRLRRDSWFKKTCSGIANRLRRAALKDTIQDAGCTLRVFRKETLAAFYPYHGMHRFFPAVAESMGFKIRQEPVAHEKRNAGKAKYGFRNRLLGPLGDLCAIRWLIKKKISYQLGKEDVR